MHIDEMTRLISGCVEPISPLLFQDVSVALAQRGTACGRPGEARPSSFALADDACGATHSAWGATTFRLADRWEPRLDG
jgi:hypothetical protein